MATRVRIKPRTNLSVTGARRRGWSWRRTVLLGIPSVFLLALALFHLADPEVAYRWWRRAPSVTLETLDPVATPLLPDPGATSLPVDEALGLQLLDLEAPRDRLRHLARVPGSEWLVAGGQGGLLFVDLSARRVGTGVAEGCVELPRSALHLLDTRDGLPDLRIEALLAEEQRVWVGTRGGLAEVRIGPDGPRVEAHHFEGGVSPRISALARDKGRLLVATHDGGLHRLEGERLLPLRQLGRRGRQLEALLELPEGGVLFGGRRGLGRIEGKDVRWYSDEWVTSLHRGRDGRVLAGGPSGLHALEGERLKPVLRQPVQRLLGTRCTEAGCAGVLPIGLDGRLLGSPPSSPLLPDHSRLEVAGIAFGATDRGLSLRDAAGHSHFIRLGGIGDADISALLVQGETLHVGTYDDGLWRVRGGEAQRIAPAIARVDALVDDGTEGLLIATPDGLWSLGPDGVTRRHGVTEGLPSDHVTDLALAPGGSLWVATAGGVAEGRRGEEGLWRFRSWNKDSGLPLSNFGVVATLPDGRVAFGALHGLVLREPDGAFVALRPGDGGLPDGWVTAIAAGPAGQVYLGTYDAGLLRLEGEKIERLSVGIGELHGRVNPRALTFLGERLIAGTQGGGLLVVGPEGTRTFGTADGLPSGEVTALASSGDTLLVGTRSGLARVLLTTKKKTERLTEVARR